MPDYIATVKVTTNRSAEDVEGIGDDPLWWTNAVNADEEIVVLSVEEDADE